MTLISWNGLSIDLHPSWEARVQGLKHLVFENDLQPLFELRWYRVKSRPNFQKECDKNGLNIKQTKTPIYFSPLKGDVFCYRQKNNQDLAGCFIYIKHQNSIIHCHLTSSEKNLQKSILNSLLLLELQTNGNWKIQDFAFNIPDRWQLDNYSFLPGLTRLQFSHKKAKIHICRLTEAKKRLDLTTEQELLQKLAGCKKINITDDANESYGYRTPTIFKQLIIRAKRKIPFIEARLKINNNIIQATVIESIYPINVEESKNIWQSYVIHK